MWDQWRVIMNRRCQHVLHWSEEMVMVQTMCQDTSSGHLLSFSSTILTLNCSASVRAVCICINCCYLWSNENNEQWDNGCYSVVSPHISMVMVWEVTNNNYNVLVEVTDQEITKISGQRWSWSMLHTEQICIIEEMMMTVSWRLVTLPWSCTQY